MTHYDTLQQNLGHNSEFGQFGPQQWGGLGSQAGQPYGGGFGQAAYGQQHGQYGGQQPFGAFGYNPGWGGQPMGSGQPQWGGQQRQLSQQDVNEGVRQLIPALPQILPQSQTPFAAMGYAAYGQTPTQLTPPDVNEVVRQILPIAPQIVGMLQSQQQPPSAAMQGGPSLGQFGGLAHFRLGHPAQTWR